MSVGPNNYIKFHANQFLYVSFFNTQWLGNHAQSFSGLKFAWFGNSPLTIDEGFSGLKFPRFGSSPLTIGAEDYLT